MNQQKKTLPVVVILAVLVGIALGALGFYFLMRSVSPGGINSETYTATTPASSSNISTIPPLTTVGTTTAAATTTGGVATSTTASVNTSSWQTYTNYELGFSMQYPPDVTENDISDPGTVTFTFPATYFSTVMKDSDSVSVVVSATCTPVTSFSDRGGTSAYPQTVVVNGISFTENIQSDIGAGNHGTSMIYDTDANDSCYRITSSARGPNDASLFSISDPAEIAEVNAAHAADAAHVAAVAAAMVQSFSFVNTPAGENEAFYSPQAAGTATGSVPVAGESISITTVSPTTISVGGQLTLNGSGFLSDAGQDTIVWISNGSVNGVLWSGMPQSDSLIAATVPAQACTQDVGSVGASGSGSESAVCPSYLVINPGIYTLTVSNQNGTTDPTYIEVQ